MNKTVLIGAVIVVAAGLGYYQFSYKPAQDAAAAAMKAADEAAAKAAEEAAAKAAADAAAAEEAAKKAAEEAAAAAAGAAQATTEAAGAAVEAATGAVTDAAAAFQGLLDPAAFDADKMIAAIDGSALEQGVKDTLKAAVTAAKANPSLVQGAIDQVKAAMGL